MQNTLCFDSFIERFNYINMIIVTDSEGVVVKNVNKTKNDKQLEKLKGTLSFALTSAYDQIAKTDNEKMKSIIAIYETNLLYQTKINNNFFIHIISNAETSNIQMIKLIATEISKLINVKELNSIVD